MNNVQTIFQYFFIENKIIEILIMISFSIIESFVLMLLFSNILKLKLSNKLKAIYLTIFAIICFTSLNCFNIPFNFLINLISSFILLKLEKTTQDLKGEILFNKSLSILNDNIRCFKHDFNNIIQSIGGYISLNDMEGLKQYYSQLINDCQKINNLSSLNPKIINNPAIYSLLASKYHKADELGIKINLDIFIDLKVINIKIYEFSRILGILLDNAIEEAKECNEKIINISMKQDNIHNRHLICIENTYNNKNIDIDKIFEKAYSTKPNNTGLGLWEIRQILSKNDNLNLFTSKNEKYFIQQLEVYFNTSQKIKI